MTETTQEPQDEKELCYEAGLAIAIGDLHKAADLCKSLLVSYPQSARGYHLTSSLFRATGNYKKAYDYSSIATGLDDCVAQYHLQQGQVLFLLKEYEQALAAFERAAATAAQHDSEICCWVGKSLSELERFDEAKEWFSRTEGVDALITEARCDIQSGNIHSAEKLLARAVARNPNNAEAHYVMALIAMVSSEFPRVEALLQKTLELDGRHTLAHFYLGMLMAESGKVQEAADRLLKALQIDPTHLPSLLVLGGIFLQCGDQAAGEKAFTHVLAIAPDHPLAWYSLLELLHENGRGREATQRLSEVIGTVPNAIVLKHLRALFNGDVPPAAPKEFIAAFYGAFVDMFEPWIIGSSDAPHVAALVAELRKLPAIEGKKYLSLLDLGCGTGVLADKLSDIAAIVVGVDVTPQMLKLARRTGKYDVRYELDITDYVTGSETIFDIVLSTGALRWAGNLQPFFQAVRGVMHKDSILGFMLDKELSTLAYSVANHGRYSHHLSYVCDVAGAEGFTLVLHKEWVSDGAIDDKMEAEKVTRHIFFFKKMTVH